MTGTRIAIIIVGCVAFVSIVFAMTVIIITGHDLTGFSIAFGSICTSAAGFIAVLRLQRRQSEVLHAQNREIQAVKNNTNGTLSKLMRDNESLAAKLRVALAKLDEDDATDVLETTIGREQMNGITNA